MVAATKFQTFVEALAEGLIDLDSHTLKMMLTNTAPTAATDDTKGDITQVANGNGYVTDGATLVVGTSGQSGGTYRLILNDASPAWTASGAVGPFRYFVLFDSTADRLIQFWDRGSSMSLAAGDTLSLNFDGTNGVLSLA
jgi:hypothetical protein